MDIMPFISTKFTKFCCADKKNSAAFSKASARDRSPTEQQKMTSEILFSWRTFVGARFAERSTVCLLTGVTCIRLNLNTSLQSVHTVRTDVFLLRDHSPLPILFIYSQQFQGFIIIFMVKLCLPVYFSVLWNFW